MSNVHERLVKPGQGVLVEQRPLGPLKRQLRSGTFPVESAARKKVQAALALPEISPTEVKTLWTEPDAKAFRNAYASEITEQIWTRYEDYLVGSESGLFTIGFDESRSYLRRISEDALDPLSSSQVADVIAASNQAVITHIVCELFRDGRVPVISGDSEKDREYLAAYQEQTDLGSRHDMFHLAIPEELGTPAAFIVKGLDILRTHVYGLPNLIDAVAQREGVTLDPDNHRKSFEETMRLAVTPFYVPTFPIIERAAETLFDMETGVLDPDKFAAHGDASEFIIFPRPQLIKEINTSLRGVDLPVQTNCPIFSNKVHVSDEDGKLPLPAFLIQTSLRQLDKWYYPRRRKEWSQTVKNHVEQ